MRYLIPNPIHLTDHENELFARIPLRPPERNWGEIADTMEELTKSILERNAVPEIRVSLFTDPQLAETGKKSRLEIFQSNGTNGIKVFRHPHFIPYLYHWISGPDLPKRVMQGMCDILNEDIGTSGMVIKQYRSFARECVREHHLDATHAAREFFRLGIEIGMEVCDARTLRDAARTTK